MSALPTFSICISTMDRPTELSRCLASIVAGSVQPLEIVVSDDSRNPDATRRVCDAFSEVRYIRGPCVGQGANRDSAACAVWGDYFCFIDDDAILSSTFIEQMRSAAATSSGREIFTGDVVEPGRRIKPTNLTFLGHFEKRADERLETVNFNASAFPRSTLGFAKFDRRLRYGYEDSDFCTQALTAGYRIVHLPDICNEHRPSPINRAASYAFREESRFYTSLKRYSLVQGSAAKSIAYLVIAPLHQTFHLARIGQLSQVGNVAADMRTALRNLRHQRREQLARPVAIKSRPMIISVVVPTYQRPHDLARCLEAISRQQRPADEIIVVIRENDFESRRLAESFLARCVLVNRPGLIASLNAGIEVAVGEIISITDDDAEPRADWLKRIEQRFQQQPCIGGVGGRDAWPQRPPAARNVGRVQWFGRLIGNHHLGIGPAREVDTLKGVNMSFRRVALAVRCFDERLRGGGAEVDNELQLCLTLKREGWRLLYDPAIVVDHHIAPRPADDPRSPTSLASVRAATHNNTVAILEHLPPLNRSVFFLWAIFVGTRRDFGLLQFLRFAPSGLSAAWARLRGSLSGRIDGYQTWRTSAN